MSRNGSENKSARIEELLPNCAAALVALCGILVLIGWAIRAEPIKRIISDRPPMVPNTALALVLLAFSLWSFAPEARSGWRTVAGRAAAAIVALAGLITIAEYLFNWNLPFDHLLLPGSAREAGLSISGRPALLTALNLPLFGL